MTSGQVEALHRAALRVLAETGVVVRDEESVRLLARHGCAVDGELVHIPGEVVAAAAESAPRVVPVEGRWGHPGVTIGESPAVVGPISGPGLVADGDRLRSVTPDDVSTFVHLCDRLPNVDLLDYLLAEEGGHPRSLYLRSVIEGL